MKIVHFLTAVFLLGLTACSSTDSGKVQSELQKIYSAISDEDYATANQLLVADNAIKEYPLPNDGSQKSLYGQVMVIETQPMANDAELVLYQISVHEKNRRIYNRLDSEGYKALEKSGKVRSVNKEEGVIVYAERKVAIRLKDGGKPKYIINPTPESIELHFKNSQQEVRQLLAKYQ